MAQKIINKLIGKSTTIAFILGIFIGLSIYQFDVIYNTTLSFLSGSVFYIVQKVPFNG